MPRGETRAPVETRRRARALELLYAWETRGRPPLEETFAGVARLASPDAALLADGHRLARNVVSRLDEIDDLIARASEHWRLDRMGLLERLVLRLGVSDLLHQALPPALAIDTALWLARRYAGAGAVPFVNGILDRIAHQLGRL